MSWREALRHTYPDALSWSALVSQSHRALSEQGFTPDNTLFANAVCRDEVNHSSVHEFIDLWGENFDLAGLGGYPSAGLTGFSAYHRHVPEQDGRLLLLFGPHVGLGSAGDWGQVERAGQRKESSDCGALMGYLGKIREDANYEPVYHPIDAEQYLLESVLASQQEAILASQTPVLEATERLFQVIDAVVLDIIARLAPREPVALLGGLVINTPLDEEDAFVVRRAVTLSAGDELDWASSIRIVP